MFYVILNSAIASEDVKNEMLREGMMPQDRYDEIVALLVQAGQAHGKYQQEQLKGVYDQEWARWYAGKMVEQGVSAALGHAVTVDQLTTFLTDSYAEFQRIKPTESWADYTARKMQEQL